MNSSHETELALRLCVFSDDDDSIEWEKDFDFTKKSKENEATLQRHQQLNDLDDSEHQPHAPTAHVALSLSVTQLLQNCVTETRQFVQDTPDPSASESGTTFGDEPPHSLLQQEILFQADRCLFKLYPKVTDAVTSVSREYHANQSRNDQQQQVVTSLPIACVTEILRAWELVHSLENNVNTIPVTAVQTQLMKLKGLFERQRDERRSADESEENLMLLVSATHEAIDQVDKQIQFQSNKDKDDAESRENELEVVQIILLSALLLGLRKLWLPFWPHIVSRLCLLLAKYLQSTDEIAISSQLVDVAIVLASARTRDEEILYLAMELLCQNQQVQMQIQQDQAIWQSLEIRKSSVDALNSPTDWQQKSVADVTNKEDVRKEDEDEEDWDAQDEESLESPSSKNVFPTKELFASETTITAPTTPTKSCSGKRMEAEANADLRTSQLYTKVNTHDLSFGKAIEADPITSRSDLKVFFAESKLRQALSQAPKPLTFGFQELEARIIDSQTSRSIEEANLVRAVWLQELATHWKPCNEHKESNRTVQVTPTDISHQVDKSLQELGQRWSFETMDDIIRLTQRCVSHDFDEFQPCLEKILHLLWQRWAIIVDHEEKTRLVDHLLLPLVDTICKVMIKSRSYCLSATVLLELVRLCDCFSAEEECSVVPTFALVDAIALSEMRKSKSNRSKYFDQVLTSMRTRIRQWSKMYESPFPVDLMEGSCYGLQLIHADLSESTICWFSYNNNKHRSHRASQIFGGGICGDYNKWQAIRTLLGQPSSFCELPAVMKLLGEVIPFIPMHLPIRYHLSLLVARDMMHGKRVGDAERLYYESVRGIDLLTREGTTGDVDFAWRLGLLEEFATTLEMNGKRSLALLLDQFLLSVIKTCNENDEIQLFAGRKQLSIEKRTVACLFEISEWDQARKIYAKIRENYKLTRLFAEVVFVTERITNVYIELGQLDNAIADLQATIDWFQVLRDEKQFGSPTFIRNYHESLELDLAVLFLEKRQPLQAIPILQRISTNFSASKARAMSASMWLLKALQLAKKFAMCEVQLHWIEHNRAPTNTGSPNCRSSFKNATTTSSSWYRIRFRNAFAAFSLSDHPKGTFQHADLFPFAAKCAWAKGSYEEALNKSALFCAYTDAHDPNFAGKAYRLHARFLRQLAKLQKCPIEYSVWNDTCCVAERNKPESQVFPLRQTLRYSDELMKQSAQMYRKAANLFQQKPGDRIRQAKCVCHWVSQATNQLFVQIAIFHRPPPAEDKARLQEELQKLHGFAHQALLVSLKTLSPILMIHCYLNVAEIGLLRHAIDFHGSKPSSYKRVFAESLYFWCEARDLLLVFFAQDAATMRLLSSVSTETISFDSIRESLQRLVRLLLCCSRTIVNENLLLFDLLVNSCEHGLGDAGIGKHCLEQELLHVLMVQGFKHCTSSLYCCREQRNLLLKECETGDKRADERLKHEDHVPNLLKPSREKASTLSTAQSRLVKKMFPVKREAAPTTTSMPNDPIEVERSRLEALQSVLASLKIHEKIFRHGTMPMESLRRLNREVVRKFLLSSQEQTLGATSHLLVDFLTYDSLLARASTICGLETQEANSQEKTTTTTFPIGLEDQKDQRELGVLRQLQGLIFVLDVGDLIASYAPFDGSRVVYRKPSGNATSSAPGTLNFAFIPPFSSSRNSFTGKVSPALMISKGIDPNDLLKNKLIVHFQVKRCESRRTIHENDIVDFSKRLFQRSWHWSSKTAGHESASASLIPNVATAFLDLATHLNPSVGVRTIICSPNLHAVPWEVAFAKCSRPQRPQFICRVPDLLMIAKKLVDQTPCPVAGSSSPHKCRVKLKLYHFRVQKAIATSAVSEKELKASIRHHLQGQLKQWLGMNESALMSMQADCSPHKRSLSLSSNVMTTQSSLGGVHGARRFLFRSLHKRFQALALGQTVRDQEPNEQNVKKQIAAALSSSSSSMASPRSTKTHGSSSSTDMDRIPVFLLTMEDLLAPSVAVKLLFEYSGFCLVFAPKSALVRVAKEIVKVSKNTKLPSSSSSSSSSCGRIDRAQLLTQLASRLEDLRGRLFLPLVMFMM